MPADQELMQRVADGDMEAFGEIVRRHQDRAWRIAYNFLRNKTQAEDVAQEAFLKILNSAGSYSASAKFTTYLYRIIANLCIDHHRAKRPDPGGNLPEREDPSRGPDEELAVKERNKTLRRALQELPARQRMATVLRYYEDLSLSEIADSMNTTYRAVEGLLARARKSLEPRLERL
ncbi:MAG: RNA polymerase sigma factor [Candidatus Brocadiia bacterium]